MTNEQVKAAVRAAALPGESRAMMAKRLDIPYVTLRRMEVFGLIHRSARLHAAYMAALKPRRKASK